MFVKPFGYERAETLADACEALRAGEGGAKAIAGGQSLLPMMNLGLLDLETVVDISRVGGLGAIEEEDGYLRIGALTRHREVVGHEVLGRRQPLLAAAARHVGSPRIRTRGTLGGSLAHSDPAAEIPLALTVLGAEYEVTNGASTRSVPAAELAVTYFTTQLAEDELLSSVRVPALGPGWGWSFSEVSRRPGDFALVAAAAIVRTGENRIVEARVGLAGVSDRAIRLGAVEAAVAGASAEDLEDRVGAIEGIEPVTDTSASADHRRHLARVLTIRALAEATRRSEENAA